MGQVAADFEHRHWIGHGLARASAILIALIGHAVVLLAATYFDFSPQSFVGDPPTAMFVELVSAPGQSRPLVTQSRAAANAAGMIDATATAFERNIDASTRPPGEANLRLSDAPAKAALSAPTPLIAPAPPATSTSRAKRAVARRTTKPRVPSNSAPQTAEHNIQSNRNDGSSETFDSTAPASAIPSNWKASILAHLDQNKRYPDNARAQREEGTALLSFSIDRNGRVLGYFLVRSSGYADLDDEVLAMIQRASPLPPVPPELGDGVVQLVVPVRFRMS